MGKIILEEQATPSTPATDKIALYPKAGGGIYKKNDAGVEEQLAEVGSAIVDSDFTAADEVMVGTGVGTHAQVTLGASEILGKKAAGTVANLSASEARSILNVENAADVTDAVNVGSSIHGVSNKATPVNADKVPNIDTENGNVLKTSTWTNIKAFLKTYFDSLYSAIADLQPPAPVAFAGSSGHTITHNYGHTNYQISVNPVADPGGFLGEIWFVKSDNTVVVYNSGTASGNFDYVITPAS
jgi:hypothetical protein